ncbi:MAG: hypothetical protein DI562_01870 [Stenotrophomonas acidaminiphila]|nr:MAG: hypothetical protein DI562_01870 [Stenotrophomonas acidaminiphila]
MKTASLSRTRSLRWLAAGTLATSLMLAGLQAAHAADDLILVVPEGTAKPEALSGHVAKWRTELGAQNVVWVDSVKREKPSGFGAMAVLNFNDAAQFAEWQAKHAAAIGAPIKATPVDVLTEGGAAPAAGSQPVYKISYYTLTSSREAFQAWVDGYLTKYLEAQRTNNILTRYAMYLEQGQGGRALLVLEYTDAKTEQAAEPIKEKLSQDIARADAEYTRQFELKESLRTTQSWTLAVPAR